MIIKFWMILFIELKIYQKNDRNIIINSLANILILFYIGFSFQKNIGIYIYRQS